MNNAFVKGNDIYLDDTMYEREVHLLYTIKRNLSSNVFICGGTSAQKPLMQLWEVGPQRAGREGRSEICNNAPRSQDFFFQLLVCAHLIPAHVFSFVYLPTFIFIRPALVHSVFCTLHSNAPSVHIPVCALC